MTTRFQLPVWARPDHESVPEELHDMRWVAFLENVAEARENGFPELCAECGVGDHTDPTMHERWCSTYEPWDGR